MVLPDKFIIPKCRIPQPFSQGVYNDCVAITLTKILEVINFIKSGAYVFLSKGYMYGRNNRPEKNSGGMDYTFTLNKLLERGTVPHELCPERDEIPVICQKLAQRDDIEKLDKLAENTKINSWTKIEGNVQKFENIKKFLYEKNIPLAGNMTGRIQHCVVIVGWDGNNILYQEHNKDQDIKSISHTKFNAAYYIDGGIEKMSEFKSYTTEEFKNYIESVRVSRNISRIQLHHTYSPAYKHFTGSNHTALQTGMRNYHVNTNGWSDIGQHFTIFPDGIIMTGRSLEMVPAGIYGGNTGSICIECIGDFNAGGDVMTEKQKNAIAGAVKMMLDRFGLSAKTAVVYHAWWSSGGTALGDYDPSKSVKTCPGTNFFGGNTRGAFEKNLLPLIENYGKEETKTENKENSLQPVESVNDIVWELSNAKIVTDVPLWIKKCEEDINVYWLCRKMANYLRGTL